MLILVFRCGQNSLKVTSRQIWVGLIQLKVPNGVIIRQLMIYDFDIYQLMMTMVVVMMMAVLKYDPIILLKQLLLQNHLLSN